MDRVRKQFATLYYLRPNPGSVGADKEYVRRSLFEIDFERQNVCFVQQRRDLMHVDERL